MIMAEVAVGLLVGCGSNFEDTKMIIQFRQNRLQMNRSWKKS